MKSITFFVTFTNLLFDSGVEFAFISTIELRRSLRKAPSQTAKNQNLAWTKSGSYFFTPTSHKHQFFDLRSGFTRLIMKIKYGCHGLVSLHVNFHDNRTMWTVIWIMKIWEEKEKKPKIYPENKTKKISKAYIKVFTSFFTHNQLQKRDQFFFKSVKNCFNVITRLSCIFILSLDWQNFLRCVSKVAQNISRFR